MNLASDITCSNIVEYNNRNIEGSPDTVPQGCIFLNKDECMIYKIRPLVCRTHGVGYFHNNPNKLCSKIEFTESNQENFVDLCSFTQEIGSVISFRDEKGSF